MPVSGDGEHRPRSLFAQSPNGGKILTASGIAAANVNVIIAAAARYKLPAIYNQQGFVAAGGLISYGPDFTDQYRRGASYVDRILRGEKPADLPVQAPNKYELAINLKTAKALVGAPIPASPCRRCDRIATYFAAPHYVRFWHKADIPTRSINVRFRG
jgi:putative ABC transport system substrate-binding protein